MRDFGACSERLVSEASLRGAKWEEASQGSWGGETGRGPGRRGDGSPRELWRTGSPSEETLWPRDLQG